MTCGAEYPATRLGRRRPFPRRDRRGLGALFSAMLVASVAVSVALLWRVTMAGEALTGHVRLLADAVSAEGYAMHHWLHEERVAGTVTVLAARTLAPAEVGRLAVHSATARWRRARADATLPVVPRGWEILHLLGTGDDLPDGVLVLRPSNDVVALQSWPAMREALDVTLGASGAGAAAIATAVLAASPLPAYDATRDRALPASRFARLDTDAVLRETHAGHAALQMETGILMGGHDLDRIAELEGDRGAIARIDGDCRPPVPPPGTLSGVLCAGSLELATTLTVTPPAQTTFATASAEDVTVTGNVTGIDRIRTGDAMVTGLVTTPALTACADPEANLCGGGDLDLEVGTGTPDWTEVSIFGDTVIRNGSQLTGVTLTVGGTGVFGTLGNGAFEVSDLLRVVNPFVHCESGNVPRCSR